MGESTEAGCDGWNSSGCTGTKYCPPRCPRFVDKQGDSWTLRPAREDDLDRLMELYDAFSPADRTLGLPPAVDHRLRSWIETLLSEGHNIVAEGSDRLGGHVVYTPVDDDRPELAVFVHPAFHNRGIGTELCSQTAAAAVEADREALELHVDRSNRAAITVYRRIGFEVVDSDHGMEMALPLDDPVATEVCAPPVDRS